MTGSRPGPPWLLWIVSLIGWIWPICLAGIPFYAVALKIGSSKKRLTFGAWMGLIACQAGMLAGVAQVRSIGILAVPLMWAGFGATLGWIALFIPYRWEWLAYLACHLAAAALMASLEVGFF